MEETITFISFDTDEDEVAAKYETTIQITKEKQLGDTIMRRLIIEVLTHEWHQREEGTKLGERV